MALRGTLTHRKTRRLARLLSIPLPCALGVLEALWHVAGEQAKDGGIGRMSNQDLADEMFWDDDPDNLVDALTKSGWIDVCDGCRLYIHDWHEHSDDATDNSLARSGTRYANGSIPRMKRLSEAERAKWRAEHGWDSHEKPQKNTTCHKEPLPVPVPVPEPDPEPVCVDAHAPASLNGFKPPTKAECREKAKMLGGESQAGEDFWLHYDSVGWKVGGNAMVNWQSRLQKWLNGDKAKPKAPSPPSKRPPPLEAEV